MGVRSCSMHVRFVLQAHQGASMFLAASHMPSDGRRRVIVLLKSDAVSTTPVN